MSATFLLDGQPVSFRAGADPSSRRPARPGAHPAPVLVRFSAARQLQAVSSSPVAGRHVPSCAMPGWRGLGGRERYAGDERRASRCCRCCLSRAITTSRRARRAVIAAAGAGLRSRDDDAALQPLLPRPAGTDALAPPTLLDFNRCIYCELCVRASRDKDGKGIFALTNRIRQHLVVNAELAVSPTPTLRR